MGKVCYCEQGVMSQCVAEDFSEQLACHFSVSCSGGGRCMHRNENLNNHCWNPTAQAFSRRYGVVRIEDVEIGEEYNIEDDFIDEAPRRTCINCILRACHDLVRMSNDALDRGGLTEQDFWTIGSGCPDYMDEEMMKTQYST